MASDTHDLQRLNRVLQGSDPRIAIKAATVLTFEGERGYVDGADVLIEGGKIEAVGVGAAAGASPENSLVIDGSDYVVMPGFVDTHRHTWETMLRHHSSVTSFETYSNTMHQGFAPNFTPDDMYVGGLLGSLSALDSGVTSLLDLSHNSRTPEHSDAAIAALKDSGIRGIYAFAAPRFNAQFHQHPQDVDRLLREHFSGEDDLVTMVMGTYSVSSTSMVKLPKGTPEPLPDVGSHIRFARERGLRTSVEGCWQSYTSDLLVRLHREGVLGSDTTYIHCRDLNSDAWNAIADSGGSVSIAPRLSVPWEPLTAMQSALDHGIRPSISLDLEFNGPGDFVRLLEMTMHLQRAGVQIRVSQGDENPPAMLSPRDVLEFGTIDGARANGMEDRTGSIAVGKDADVLLFNVAGINAVPLNDPFRTILLSSSRGSLDAVLVRGRPVKWAGELVGVDVRQIRAMAERSRDGLVERTDLTHV